jgi:hypothetical protein
VTAYISGQAGVCACRIGDQWFVLRVGEDRPSPSSGAVARRILADADDLREARIASIEELPPLLDQARRQESALLCLTATLEGVHSADVNARMLAALRDVQPGPVLEFLRNRLYMAPFPPATIPAVGKLSEALGPGHCVRDMLEEAIQRQQAIRRVREVWDRLESAKFDPPASKDEWRWRLADEGWNWRLATGCDIAQVVAQEGAERGVVVDWAARVVAVDAGTRAAIPDGSYEPRCMLAA